MGEKYVHTYMYTSIYPTLGRRKKEEEHDEALHGEQGLRGSSLAPAPVLKRERERDMKNNGTQVHAF